MQRRRWRHLVSVVYAACGLPLVDALIAAVAQAKGAVLVHRDAHMRAIPPELLQLNDLEAVS